MLLLTADTKSPQSSESKWFWSFFVVSWMFVVFQSWLLKFILKQPKVNIQRLFLHSSIFNIFSSLSKNFYSRPAGTERHCGHLCVLQGTQEGCVNSQSMRRRESWALQRATNLATDHSKLCCCLQRAVVAKGTHMLSTGTRCDTCFGTPTIQTLLMSLSP